MPGYGTLHTFFLDYFSFDVTVLVTIAALGWSLKVVCLHIYDTIYGFIWDHWTSQILVREDDTYWHYLRAFLSAQNCVETSQAVEIEDLWE